MNKPPSISIVIIGYNTCQQLRELLISINNLNIKPNNLEVVYIDDGSSDNSYNMFSSFEVRYKKTGKRLPKNLGRVEATQEGISQSSGEWLLFIRSNENFNTNTLEEYLLAVNSNLGVAYMGSVNYSSNDKIFVSYLNNQKRGAKLFDNGDVLHYRYLLFNNSLIHKSIFKKIVLNKAFRNYGGEELDFSFRLSKIYKKKIIAWPSAVVNRSFYPSLREHCLRLEEFGGFNFLLLNHELKKEVIKLPLLLYSNHFFKLFNSLVLSFLFWLYAKNNNLNISYYIVRASFLCSILKGYYNASKLPESKSSIVASSQSSDRT
tara:strand:+ start:867 stop:1823 length:957 start_codon:yes stop_codon:yes gene_type:complete